MPETSIALNPSRVGLVDALRGFAILGIVLTHSLEHFRTGNYVASDHSSFSAVEQLISNSVFFLFSGKCYAIFALMFGFSFYIQSENREKRGEPFVGRFFWRMCLLAFFGLFHRIYYSGDILFFYALVGMIMIPFRNLSNKVLVVLMIVMALEPLELGQLGIEMLIPESTSVRYMNEYGQQAIEGNSFWNVAQKNVIAFSDGLLFIWQSGRASQTIALFMAGILLGRQGLFTSEKGKGVFWIKAWIYSTLGFASLYMLKSCLSESGSGSPEVGSLLYFLKIWRNLFFMAFWVSSLSLLWFYTRFVQAIARLMPLGKMSLTNYMGSSLLGALICYNYALGLYDILGPLLSLLMGIGILAVLWLFSRWWLSRHRRGPLEIVWHKLTWAGKK